MLLRANSSRKRRKILSSINKSVGGSHKNIKRDRQQNAVRSNSGDINISLPIDLLL